jgi:hypothetical protein
LPAPWYQWDGDDLLLAVHIQPRSSRDCIDGTHGDRLKIRITAPPADGRANEHLVRFLAGEFGVPRRRVTLLAGTSARAKRIRIERPARIPGGLPVARPRSSQ